MATADLPAIRKPESPNTNGLATIASTMDALKAFRTFVQGELKPNLDFGVIPGTGKPTLLQPGAQKICLYHNAYPDHKVTATELGKGHIEYLVTTLLISRSTDKILGQGVGSCSSMESRYRFRNASKKCPNCGNDKIIKGKEEYGGGWICFAKKGGCGSKFLSNDRGITDQPVGQVENENIHDVRNTVLKMAVKRSLVAASLAMGCASEMFTQDIEDTYDLTIVGSGGEVIEPEVMPARDTRRDEVNKDFAPSNPKAPRHPDNVSGHGRGQYASPEQVAAWTKRRDTFIKKANAAWVDKFTDPDTGDVPEGVKDLLSSWQVDGHLLKWAQGQDPPLLDPSIDPSKVKSGQRASYVAVIYHSEDGANLVAEMKAYSKAEADAGLKAWRAAHPEGEEPNQEPAIPAEDVSQEAGA